MRKSLPAGVLLAVSMLAFGGCSAAGGGRTDSKVATLQTGQAAASASAPSADDARPLVRPDMSGADIVALYNLRGKCLIAHGVPTHLDGSGAEKLIKSNEGTSGDPKYQAAFGACANLIPETWMDREARTDPEYPDLMYKVQKCVEAKGFPVTLQGDPLELHYSSGEENVRAGDTEVGCVETAFAAQMKKYKS
jgi:hypothetical protein